jgi:hypothetical protein
VNFRGLRSHYGIVHINQRAQGTFSSPTRAVFPNKTFFLMSVGIRLSTAAIASLGSRLRDDGTIVENRQVGLFENGKYIEMTILV